ncbi:MAG: HAD family phosphatase [Chlamydiia bacterium]|nr:HAD family phosphatase [Chlamydiia bacterium]
MFFRTLFLSLFTVAALAASPQAVVFDFGGVMTGEQHPEVVASFLRETFSYSEKDFQMVLEEKRRLNRKGMSDEEFWLRLSLWRRVILPEDWISQFRAAMRETLNPNEEMFRLVQELKERGVRVAMLSNIDERHAQHVRNLGLYEPFDPCLLSFEIGVQKPSQEAYQILLSILQLPGEEVLFIDDKRENVEAAKSVGIDGILFDSFEQLLSELEERGFLVDSACSST